MPTETRQLFVDDILADRFTPPGGRVIIEHDQYVKDGAGLFDSLRPADYNILVARFFGARAVEYFSNRMGCEVKLRGSVNGIGVISKYDIGTSGHIDVRIESGREWTFESPLPEGAQS